MSGFYAEIPNIFGTIYIVQYRVCTAQFDYVAIIALHKAMKPYSTDIRHLPDSFLKWAPPSPNPGLEISTKKDRIAMQVYSYVCKESPYRQSHH